MIFKEDDAATRFRYNPSVFSLFKRIFSRASRDSSSRPRTRNTEPAIPFQFSPHAPSVDGSAATSALPRLPLPSSSSEKRGGAPDQSRQLALREVFTPTRPQRSGRRLTGRQDELMRIFRAIALDRAHVVLYGERGRGKTSLVNMVASTARNSGYMVGRYACSSESKFDDIIRGLVRDLPASMLTMSLVEDAELEGCEAALPHGRLQPRDVASLPSRLIGHHLVLIADEFDRVVDGPTRTLFADTIKQTSDQGAALSFVIVGVSDSLEELLGQHPSIQRNIASVPLPLLKDGDIDEILVKGGQQTSIEFSDTVRKAVIRVAWGVPYVAQLLALHAATEAVMRHSTTVDAEDLEAAFRRAIQEIDPRVAALYQTVTAGGRDHAMVATLRALASGEQDQFARFIVTERGNDGEEAGRRVDPQAWKRLLEAQVVRRCPSIGPDTFAFAEPMLQHYILIRSSLEPDPAAVPTDV